METTAELSPEIQTAVNVYAEGIRDANAMLEDLTEFYSEQSEPVLLVFFGDHLPYLGDNRQGYAELGLPAAKRHRRGGPLRGLHRAPSSSGATTPRPRRWTLQTRSRRSTCPPTGG